MLGAKTEALGGGAQWIPGHQITEPINPARKELTAPTAIDQSPIRK